MRSLNTRVLRNATAMIALTAASYGLQAQTTRPDPATPGGGMQPANSAASIFKRVDANQDGKISREEAARMPALAEKFDQIDKDADSSLSMAEFSAAVAPSSSSKPPQE